MQEAFGHRDAAGRDAGVRGGGEGGPGGAAGRREADGPGRAAAEVSGGTGASAAEAIEVLDVLLAELGGVVHRPAPLERGFALEAGDWPLHVGARAVAGLLELQAEIAPPGAIDPVWLLHRNRRDVRVVRYACSAEGATWVHGDLVLDAVTPAALDDLLARMVGAAQEAAAVAVWPDWC